MAQAVKTVESVQQECLSLIKEANEKQRQIFVILEPLLGREEAAAVLGAMVMKYFEKASRSDNTLDKKIPVHELAQRAGKCTYLYGLALQELVTLDPTKSKVRETVNAVNTFHQENDEKVFSI